MAIEHVILGFLNWQPMSGYDLKKAISDAPGFYWSGNNNQIYRSLVDLHNMGLVSSEVQQQEHYPARKLYTITESGRAELRRWLVVPPEVPQLRNGFLAQLAWADELAGPELDALLERYEHEVGTQLLVQREQQRRARVNPARTPREQYLWQAVGDNWTGFYENELAWVQRVRAALQAMNVPSEAEADTTAQGAAP